MRSFSDLRNLYKTELLDNIIPFWLNNSIDIENGGYFNSLTRTGKVFDTDKFTWLQAREVWTFSMLYNKLEKREEWLDAAIIGADFLLKHGHNDFDWYFSMTKEGKPLTQPYNIFSYTFSAMAFASLYNATGNNTYKEASQKTFRKIIQRKDNLKGEWNKYISSTRQLKSFSFPMILCNLVLEMENVIDKDQQNETISTMCSEVINTFYKEDIGLILENVETDGTVSDTYDGRLINPGHSLEAMWFVMNIAVSTGNIELITKTKNISLEILNYGWDKTHGGIYYFMDIKNQPPIQLEWDQKLWWVHLEALIVTIKGYALTKDERCLEWFDKLHNYTWSHFKDNEHPEWFGYLNRRGEVLLDLKGGKWKGCFHLPRALFEIWKTLEQIESHR